LPYQRFVFLATRQGGCLGRSRNIDIDYRHIIGVLFRLDEEGAAIEINVQIVIMPGQNEIGGVQIHELCALLLVCVQDGCDEIGTGRAQAFGSGSSRENRRQELQIARARSGWRIFVGDADEPELDAVRLESQAFLMIGGR
jgi:hypothetical protein